jgi:peptidylprolyl isomerase
MAKQDYIDKNREWLKAKSQEPGVKLIDKGIYYKTLKKGNGAKPNRNSVVTVHYVGKTINGKQFDSSRGGAPVAFRLREMGYGKFSQPGIPGGSTLIFDIELIAVN